MENSTPTSTPRFPSFSSYRSTRTAPAKRAVPSALPTLLALLAALSMGCAPKQPSELELAGIEAQTFVVAPFNLASSLPSDLAQGEPLVSKDLVDHLEAHGKTVEMLSLREGKDLWKQAAASLTAAGGERNFDNAARHFARILAEQREFDILIIPSLFVQNARMSGRTVRWDGQSERMKFEGRRIQGFQMRGNQSVRAASILVNVLDRQGEIIHSRRSGLELLEHVVFYRAEKAGDMGSSNTEPDNPPLAEEELIRLGVTRSLSPFLSMDVPENAAE